MPIESKDWRRLIRNTRDRRILSLLINSKGRLFLKKKYHHAALSSYSALQLVCRENCCPVVSVWKWEWRHLDYVNGTATDLWLTALNWEDSSAKCLLSQAELLLKRFFQQEFKTNREQGGFIRWQWNPEGWAGGTAQLSHVVHVLTYGGHGGGGRGDEHPVVMTTLWASGRGWRAFSGGRTEKPGVPVSPLSQASGSGSALRVDSQLGRRSQTTNPAVNRCTGLIYSDFIQRVRLFVHYSIYYQTWK